MTPGFDGEDDRRGPNFQGTVKQISSKINDFMRSLQIEKAIFLVHSFGFCYYLNFEKYFPQKIAGVCLLGTFGYYAHDYAKLAVRVIESSETWSLIQEKGIQILDQEKYRE